MSITALSYKEIACFVISSSLIKLSYFYVNIEMLSWNSAAVISLHYENE